MDRAFRWQRFSRIGRPQQRSNFTRSYFVVASVQVQHLPVPRQRKRVPTLSRPPTQIAQSGSTHFRQPPNPLVATLTTDPEPPTQCSESSRLRLQRLLQKPPPLFLQIIVFPRHMPQMCYLCRGRRCYPCRGTMPPCLPCSKRSSASQIQPIPQARRPVATSSRGPLRSGISAWVSALARAPGSPRRPRLSGSKKLSESQIQPNHRPGGLWLRGARSGRQGVRPSSLVLQLQ